MPNYRLHLHDVHVDADDQQGHELPDLAAAHTLAVEGIRGFLTHEILAGRLDLRGQVDIADDAGAILETIRFADAVTLKGLTNQP